MREKEPPRPGHPSARRHALEQRVQLGFDTAVPPAESATLAPSSATRTRVENERASLCQLLLDDPEPMLTHNEPILRDGERAGYTLSSGYAHTLGGCAAMGYLRCEDGVTADFVDAGSYRIEQADRIYDARASLTPMYDPKNERIRC